MKQIFSVRGIVAKLLVPTSALVLLTIIVVGWLVTRHMGEQIETLADEQMNGRIRATLEHLMTVDELSLLRVHASIRLLMDEGKSMGEPSLGSAVTVGQEVVPDLVLGKARMANDPALVDHITSVMEGTATLFVRRGDDFVRVTTNVKKTDGTRAVGTMLDPNGKVILLIREGKAFYGVVDILGSPYMTGYEPITDAHGSVIGIWYAGYRLSSLTKLGESIASSRVLDSGFVALCDKKGDVIFHSAHTTGEKVREVIAGFDHGDESWDLRKETFGPWGYTVVAGHSLDDIGDDYALMYKAVAAGAAVVVGLLIAIMFVLLKRAVLRPMQQVVVQMDNADLNTGFHSTREDEVGDLERSFDRFVGSVRETLLEVAEASHAVASASSQISSSAEEMAAGAQEQTSQTGEVASAVEQMTKTIVDNSRNAGTTASTAHRAREAAEEGGRVVRDTVQGMQQIASVVKESAKTVQELGNSSNQIGEIVSVIDDIADQTNLLALNAAIEAARAGDQGRGFAVVADEVRKLAERTTKATREIAQMIRKIQEETRGAVESMTQGTHKVDEGIQLADKAGVSLTNIVDISQQVTEMVTQIAAASEEQSGASEQISRNIEAISNVTQQSASSTHQIARAAEDLNRLTENLQRLVERFNLAEARSGREGMGSHITERPHASSRTGSVTFDIEAAKNAHRMWRVRVQKMLLGTEQVREADVVSHKECMLGRWYYGDGRQTCARFPVFAQLGSAHEEMHIAVMKTVRLWNNGETAEAEKMSKVVYKLSATVISLLGELEQCQTRAVVSPNGEIIPA